jgi:type VI secretion system secreted protein Hcp
MAEMFLRLEGFVGESSDIAHGGPRPHANDIELIGWEWELKNEAKFELEPKESAKLMKPDTISVTKGVDLASTKLMQYCTLGTIITKATLTCRKNAGDQKLEYLVINLTDAKVMSVNWAQDEHIVKETVALAFVTIEAKYLKQANSGGAADGVVRFGWDFGDNKPV